MIAGPYFCTKSGCRWDHFTKSVDWGYLDESNGDCESCRKKCQGEKKCKAFECGSTYCSWWARGTCDEMSKDTIYATKNSTDGSQWETCRITGILMSLFLSIKVDALISKSCSYYLPFQRFLIFTFPSSMQQSRTMLQWWNMR